MSVLVWIDERSEVSASLDQILFHSCSIVLVAFWVCLVVFSIGPSSATVRTRLSLSFLIQIFHDVGLQNVLSNSVEPWGHPVAS